MTSKKASKGKKTTAQEADMARKIWLAGVGAYDKMYNEAHGAAGKFATNAGEAFNQLVAKGEEVEDAVRDRIAKSAQGERVATLVSELTAKAQKLSEEQASLIQARLGKAQKALGEALAPWNVSALGQAVEKLSGQVESLTREVRTLKAQKPAPAMAAKAAAPKTTKATAKPKARAKKA